MQEPIPFITLEGEPGNFAINPEAVRLLAQVDDDLAVISIAGLYRTGKSYILNRLAGSSRGFDVGSKVEPCTQGIHLWIVKNPPVIPELPPQARDKTIVLLDTEGLGSYKKSKTYDTQIFALSLLLSSIFIYNSMGSIDEGALDRLSLVAELSNNIKMGQTENEEDAHTLSKFFPKFVWLVRDFGLKLELDGQPITENEYLENALKPLPGDQDRVKSKNRIRQSITQFFPDRSCFTLKRPVADESLLQKLETVTEDQLRPQFLEGVKEFLKFVFAEVKTKTVYGERVNGRMFAKLTESYVQALNEGGVPVIKNAWENVLEAECQRAAGETFKVFESEWQKTFGALEAPVDEEEIKQKKRELKSQATNQFRTLIKGAINETHEQRLKDRIREYCTITSRHNAQLSDTSCDKLLQNQIREIDEQVNNGHISNATGLQQLWNEQVNEYLQQAKGSAKHETAVFYLRNRPFEHFKQLESKQEQAFKNEAETRVNDTTTKLSKEYANLESLYNDVKSSWLKSREEIRELTAENEKLIHVVVKFSDIMNEATEETLMSSEEELRKSTSVGGASVGGSTGSMNTKKPFVKKMMSSMKSAGSIGTK